ncbi:hypothetical protein CH314_01290 [Lysinibacillus fusiformis]|nr:hypothetical protein CH314_01290 [Lysinibacillus fusiformis]
MYLKKPGGLVVDYNGISDNLKQALKQYTDSDRETAGVDTALAVDVMLEKHQLILELLHGQIETSKVIEELIELAKEMDGAYKRGVDNGMVMEEIAFYDALASHDTAEQVLETIR